MYICMHALNAACEIAWCFPVAWEMSNEHTYISLNICVCVLTILFFYYLHINGGNTPLTITLSYFFDNTRLHAHTHAHVCSTLKALLAKTAAVTVTACVDYAAPALPWTCCEFTRISQVNALWMSHDVYLHCLFSKQIKARITVKQTNYTILKKPMNIDIFTMYAPPKNYIPIGNPNVNSTYSPPI